MKKYLIFLSAVLFLSCDVSYSQDTKEILVEQQPQSSQSLQQEQKTVAPVSVDGSMAKGMHLSQFVAGSEFLKNKTDELLNDTELNAVVIDVKETNGIYCIKGIKDNIAYSSKIPNFMPYLKQLKERGVYTIARIVVFRDDFLPRKRPDLAVVTPEGELWQDRNKTTWLNPYKQEVTDYILELAQKTADAGFDEIQFDYIRFPSDGPTRNCRYGVEHSSVTASKAVVSFLKQANAKLSPKGIKLSIDVFGLTTTEKGDMGIGQKIVEMTKYVDYVSPMIYPSHYPAGCYGIENPNKEPYRTVYLAVAGGINRIPPEKMRPWIQDFSMRGVKYGPEEIKAQIQACFDVDVKTWLLWNAACRYTKAGLKSKENQDDYKKSSQETINKLLKNDTVESAIKKSKHKVKKSTSTAVNKTQNTTGTKPATKSSQVKSK